MTKYLFPRYWLGRVIVAWLGGLVVAVPVTVLSGVAYFVAAFWSLVVIMAAFVTGDVVRARRSP